MLKRKSLLTDIFDRQNIAYEYSMQESASIFHLVTCPVCGNGSSDHPNQDCQLIESPAYDGSLKHDYRCFHSEANGDALLSDEFFDSIGIDPTRLQPAASDSSRQKKAKKNTDNVVRITPRSSHGEHTARLHSRLLKNPAALSWLNREKGIDPETLQYFGAGLSEPYKAKNSGKKVQDALTFPVMGTDGQLGSYRTYIDIPEVTQNPRADFWSAHEAETYYSRQHKGRPDVLVFENVLDLWAAYQFLSYYGHEQDYLLITSSIPDSFPIGWQPGFFRKFRNVYVCPAHPESKFSSRLTTIVGTETKLVSFTNNLNGWSHFFHSLDGVEPFLILIDDSLPINLAETEGTQDSKAIDTIKNYVPYDPIDCNGAFHNGFLYYPARFVEKDTTEDPTGNPVIAESIKTVLIRSDRTIQKVFEAPLVATAKRKDVVKRLTDNTMILKEPAASANQTWTYQSITNYLKGESDMPDLSSLLHSIRNHLSACVWLPNEDDYTVMSLVAATSYCMPIFESVPLVLLTGEKGTGKTEFSNAIIQVSANAAMIGQGSPAAIARQIDNTRGLLVLDDMDHLGGKSRSVGQTEQLRQLIKQSYSKKSASKVVFDGSRENILNFYGIKVINNTTGIDPITGSRCLHIFTSKIPPLESQAFIAQSENQLDYDDLTQLRDSFHTWVILNPQRIDHAYQQEMQGKTDRTDEIHAPLRTFAKLSGDKSIIDSLEKALARQKLILGGKNQNPVDLLIDITKELILQGHRSITPTHVYLEMLVRLQGSVTSTLSVPGQTFSPEWVGRQLRAQNLVSSGGRNTRKTIRGHKLRILEITPDAITKILGKNLPVTEDSESLSATSFCQFPISNSCNGCRYSSVQCTLKKKH
ncbi:MAG: hypothetical protein AB2657_02780 [Candidatus Thiodiazotropha endolucinida]